MVYHNTSINIGAKHLHMNIKISPEFLIPGIKYFGSGSFALLEFVE